MVSRLHLVNSECAVLPVTVLTIASLLFNDSSSFFSRVGALVICGDRSPSATSAVFVASGDPTVRARRTAAVRVTNANLVATSALETVAVSTEVSKLIKLLWNSARAVCTTASRAA